MLTTTLIDFSTNVNSIVDNGIRSAPSCNHDCYCYLYIDINVPLVTFARNAQQNSISFRRRTD